eukprot:333088-Chlamydomonas_euryale.AAC.1
MRSGSALNPTCYPIQPPPFHTQPHPRSWPRRTESSSTHPTLTPFPHHTSPIPTSPIPTLTPTTTATCSHTTPQELAEERSEQLFPITIRRKTSKLINMISVIAASIGLIMTGYLVVGVSGYIAYPESVSGNVLNVLPKDDPWVQ